MQKKQPLTKEMIADAVSIILELESPETFSTKEKLAKALEDHFDATVNPEDVTQYVRVDYIDAVDRYLTLKNIGI